MLSVAIVAIGIRASRDDPDYVSCFALSVRNAEKVI